MASTTGPTCSIARQDVNTLVRQVNRLLNRQLSSICQVNGIKSTGIKADLQNRINNLIQDAVHANDPLRFQQIRQSVLNTVTNYPATAHAQAQASTSYAPSPARTPTQLSQPSGTYGNGYPHANGHRPGLSYGAMATPSLSFKPSPFYQIEHAVGDVRTCEAMSQHRNTVSLVLVLNEHTALQDCVSNKNYRVMVFCAGDSVGVQDVAFPHQSELRVNGGEIKANLRGLKNKPGSTRPVDITSALRLRPNYTNNIDFTYALTTKAGGRQKFFLVLYVCKVTSVDELVSRITVGQRIPKESVIHELKKKAQDPDVVATSQVLSLKCPLSYMRLDLPCRGLSCTHMQCFDATSYLQLQEQGPQWLCPICSKSAPFEQLAVDEYVRDILTKTSKSLETVTIEPNGRWLIKHSEEERPAQSNGSTHHDDDDDELEISEINPVSGRRLETPRRPTPSTSTPLSSSRDASSLGPRGTASVSSKRPISVVIDLTVSSDDDDDDEPIQRPTKRQSTVANGYHGPSSIGPPSETSCGNPA